MVPDVKKKVPLTGKRRPAVVLRRGTRKTPEVRVRWATSEPDAESIVNLQSTFLPEALDPADFKNGWIYKRFDAPSLHVGMRLNVDAFVLELDREDAGYQLIGTQDVLRQAGYPLVLTGEHAPLVDQDLRDFNTLYMMQVAMAPEAQGQGLARALRAFALAHYHKLSQIALVAGFDQAAIDQWDGDPESLQSEYFNEASHKLRTREGAKVSGFYSKLDHPEFNSGGAGFEPILGIVYWRPADAPPCDDAGPEALREVASWPKSRALKRFPEQLERHPERWEKLAPIMGRDTGFVANPMELLGGLLEYHQGVAADQRLPGVEHPDPMDIRELWGAYLSGRLKRPFL